MLTVSVHVMYEYLVVRKWKFQFCIVLYHAADLGTGTTYLDRLIVGLLHVVTGKKNSSRSKPIPWWMITGGSASSVSEAA